MKQKKYTAPKLRWINIDSKLPLLVQSGGGNSLQGIQHEGFQENGETVEWDDEGSSGWSWH